MLEYSYQNRCRKSFRLNFENLKEWYTQLLTKCFFSLSPSCSEGIFSKFEVFEIYMSRKQDLE